MVYRDRSRLYEIRQPVQTNRHMRRPRLSDAHYPFTLALSPARLQVLAVEATREERAYKAED